MLTLGIVSYNIYPYLYLPHLKISGGAELQLATLARLLNAKGIKIVFFTGDFGQEDGLEIDGYTFYKVENTNANKLVKIWRLAKLIKRINPNCLLERGTSAFTFINIFLCRILHIPFVFCGASDVNFAKGVIDPYFGGSRIKQRLYELCLPFVSHFIVQKLLQADMLKKNYGIHSNVTLIKNFPPEIELTTKVLELNWSYEYDAIWVANWIPYKQPEMFLELARMFPEHKFLIVGSSVDNEYDRMIREKAGKLGNMTITGYLSPSQVAPFMQKCKVVVNTTKIANGFEEGFSNVQLMGWMLGMPSLTLFSDPDGLIEVNKMGFCSGSFDQLCIDFSKLMEDKAVFTQAKVNALNYVKDNHNKEAILEKYINILSRYN